MQHLTNIESTLRPDTITPFGINGIDYNFNIEEVVTISQRQKQDEFGNYMFDEDGNPIMEDYEVISYVYECYRFLRKGDFTKWANKNNINIK